MEQEPFGRLTGGSGVRLLPTCVELANHGAVRDSKNPTGPVLMVGLGGFLGAVKSGRFDR